MRSYLICDARSNETPCVYCETSLRKLRSDPPRCIKHGTIDPTKPGPDADRACPNCGTTGWGSDHATDCPLNPFPGHGTGVIGEPGLNVAIAIAQRYIDELKDDGAPNWVVDTFEKFIGELNSRSRRSISR